MISELMQAMVECAPKKARAIQNDGRCKLKEYVTSLARTAPDEVEAQTDPNREWMVREIAFQAALEAALAPMESDPQTT